MNANRIPGLRFRIRHLLILAAYFALILGILVPFLRHFGSAGQFNAPLAILLLSPWLLGTLVLILERDGPVKFWAAPLLLAATAPALAICHDWLILDNWLASRTAPNIVVTLLVNILMIGSFTIFLVTMAPERCPHCSHRALIPLLRFWGRNPRTSQTRWCGSCGSQYWRHRDGDWQVERRTTWVDKIVSTPQPKTPHRKPSEPKRHDGIQGEPKPIAQA